jgi:hypothetical protein
MFRRGQLNRCEARKQQLIEQSAASREALREAFAPAQPFLRLMDSGLTCGRAIAAIASATGPLGQALFSSGSSEHGWLAKLAAGMRVMQSVLNLAAAAPRFGPRSRESIPFNEKAKVPR